MPFFIYVLSIIFGQKQEECVLTPELISGAKSWCFHKQIHIYCLEGAPQKGPRQQLSRHLPGADAARCVCQNNQKKIRSKNGNDANKIMKINIFIPLLLFIVVEFCSCTGNDFAVLLDLEYKIYFSHRSSIYLSSIFL